MNFRAAVTLFFLLTATIAATMAQIGPMQDCDDAIPVCENRYVQTRSFQGTGSVEDLRHGSTCLENDENNSVWYVFTIGQSGVLEFSIAANGASPNDTVDYDFALFNITGLTCASIKDTNLVVRCNYAFTDSVTGLRAGYANTSSNATGPPFCAPLNVYAGETYTLLVDNFGATQFGYILDFSASTAVVKDTIRPSVSSIDSLRCDDTDSLVVHLSEPVVCSSLDALGSDFLVTGPSAVTITRVYGPSCAVGGFTQTAILNLSSPIATGGNYALSLVRGTDNNTFIDNCNNEALPASFPFFVPHKVTAGFTFQKFASCAADTFMFSNTSQGNITSYLWDFGDSSASAVQNPTHVYPVTGSYTVTLTAFTNDCSDSYSNSILVTNNIDVAITYDPPHPCTGLPVSFSDASSYTPSAEHYWYFGDGNSSTSQNPTHTFSVSGNYDVEFVVIDRVNNCPPDTAWETIVVSDPAAAAFTFSNPVCSDTVVNFTDASTGTPSSWTWTFHDGSIIRTRNTSFVYDAAGSYPVQLAVQDACGTDTESLMVHVMARPKFSLGKDTSLCLNETIVLTISAVPAADNYRWSTGQTSPAITFGSVPDTVRATAFLNGCRWDDELIIHEKDINECSFAIVPTGFSPNGDGKNDLLRVKTKDVSDYELIIYNRWGQEVFREKNDDRGGWDGYFKDEPLDAGVFAYIILWTPLHGKQRVDSGTVTLVR